MLSCAGYEYCFSLNNREKQIRTAHRCAPKVATAYLPPPPCGARKNLCAARLLDFFDRCGCFASLHPPLAALGFAPPFPSPPAGEGPSGQIAACSTRRLGSVTSCYRFAVTQHKMRRRHLESVSAAPYGSTFQHLLKSPIRIQPQLSGKGVLGHSPKRVLVPFTRVKGTPRRRGVQAVTLR